MEERLEGAVSPPTEGVLAEERMLGADLVQEIVARKGRGEGVKRIARELGIDRKTVKRWLGLGHWQPRQSRQVDYQSPQITSRLPSTWRLHRRIVF